jgi:hypothetical protein
MASHALAVNVTLSWDDPTITRPRWVVITCTTGKLVTSAFYSLGFKRTFSSAPVFLADMQTANGGDTANLRWRNKGHSEVQVQVDKELSQDSETGHTTETVGYITRR